MLQVANAVRHGSNRPGRAGCTRPLCPSAEGTLHESPARKCREPRPLGKSPAGTALRCKHRFVFVLDSALPQYRHEFFLKRPPRMMLRLMLDVMADYIAIGCTDTKRAITFLPCEFDSMLSEPSGRIRLERLYGLGEGHIGRKSNQHMHMVRHAARCNHGNPNVRSDSVQVCDKLWKKIRWNEIAPFLRAENHVNQDIGIFVSHGAAPSELSSGCDAYQHSRAGLSCKVPSALPPCSVGAGTFPE
jgi:hypothetical protein